MAVENGVFVFNLNLAVFKVELIQFGTAIYPDNILGYCISVSYTHLYEENLSRSTVSTALKTGPEVPPETTAVEHRQEMQEEGHSSVMHWLSVFLHLSLIHILISISPSLKLSLFSLVLPYIRITYWAIVYKTNNRYSRATTFSYTHLDVYKRQMLF